ncbi:uncharacterized protein T551_02894 [Pneumocystis jirovecii RU7]|uniref:Exosome complex component RRP45 n=1 Tax=Pneumocystis jirovecii (strain RU7) TaxID=1408657 RepID=A0A0W4ZHS6_PNEJ7|nr:uncharacterized protein T551_02894 [Pneumocystis jirovecii RU7]KTW27927.1 hypothetical protein T551_02894 [Pneumocystis jirovecii RU7]
MPKDIDLSLNEKEFILEALNNNLRLDGRGFDVWRDLKLNFGNSYGHVELSLGKTRIFVRISAEITEPYPDKPYEGIFTIDIEMTPIVSSFESWRLSEEMTVSSIIDKAIRRSHMLDKESLCIIYGKQCWSIRADVHYLDHDGNLIDATSIAVVAALYHFKKPVVTVEGEKVIVHSIEERVPVPLILTHIPISITFSFFNENQISLMDTTLQEEKLREGSMVITLNKNKEICQISKVGGVILQTSHILKCLQLASKKALEITNYLNEKLKENEQSTNSIYDKR